MGQRSSAPRARLAIVSVQIALTVGMLGASSLLLRSLWKLAVEPLGFDAARVVAAPVRLNAVKQTPRATRASRIPGTQSAAITDFRRRRCGPSNAVHPGTTPRVALPASACGRLVRTLGVTPPTPRSR